MTDRSEYPLIEQPEDLAFERRMAQTQAVVDARSVDVGADWRSKAQCQTSDPEIFFPQHTTQEAIARAKKVCGRCTVREACLQYALENGENFGIWGGMTEGERRALRRRAASSRRVGGAALER